MREPDPPELNDDPVEVSDAELVAGYQRTAGEGGNPDVEALLAEIGRRGLDV